MQVYRRGSGYSLRKWVPGRYAPFEPRREVLVSLHIKGRREAETKARQVWEALVQGWESRLAMREGDATERFAAAREIAARQNFAYLPPERVLTRPEDEVLARIAAIARGPSEAAEAEALLGHVEAPTLKVTGALEAYWRLARENVLGKNEDRVRRWRNPRIKVAANFVAVVGHRAVDQITGDDMLDLRRWWLERIEAGEVGAGSANKDLGHLAGMLNHVNVRRRLGLDLPLGELAFKEGEKRTRPPFSREWIAGRILAPGALDGTNPEARGLLLLMVNTGLRPSEAASLTSNTIILDDAGPHIEVRDEGRQMKSRNARRTIPVLGVSLDALRHHPGASPAIAPAPPCPRPSNPTCGRTA